MDSGKPQLTQYGDYLGLGIQIAATMVLPMFAGIWLDNRFDTSPWLTLAGALFGILSIFVIIMKLALTSNQKEVRRRKKQGHDPT